MEKNTELSLVIRHLADSTNPAAKLYIKRLENNFSDYELFDELSDFFTKNSDYLGKEKLLLYLLKINPTSEIYSLLGNTYKKLNKDLEAMECFNKAIENDPNNFVFRYNKGVFLYERQKYESALSCFLESVQCNKNFDLIYYNLGNTYSKLKTYAEAIKSYKMAIELNDRFAAAFFNLGVVYENIKLPSEALNCYDRAVAIEPENYSFRWNRSLLLLYFKKFDEGFKEYEWRIKKPNYKYKLPGNRWIGENISGKRLLIYCEQGFGDALLYIRFLKYVKGLNATIILYAKNELLKLFIENNFAHEYYNLDNLKADNIYYDYYVSLLSLPNIFEKDFFDAEIKYPYIVSEKDSLNISHLLADNGVLNVGIVWKGNPEPAENRVRHTDLANFKEISNHKSIKLFSLMPGGLTEEEKNNDVKITDLSKYINNFSDTASIINKLDLVITIDSALAHLAGAMGKNTFLLIPDTLDWRWNENGNKSSLYPTVSIIKQIYNNNWESVFEELYDQILNFPENEKNETPVEVNDSELIKSLEKLAVENFNLGNFNDAVSYYVKCIELDKNNSRLLNNLGLAYQKSLNYEQAEKKYLESISINEDYESPRLNLISLYLDKENYDLAENELYKALEKFGYTNEITFYFGLLNHKLNKYDEAEKYYIRLSDIDPENFDVMINLGMLYNSTGHFLKASNLFMEAIQKYPQKPELYFNLGNVYKNFEEYESAINWYLKAIQLNKTYVDAYLNIGSAYFNMGRFDDSIEIYNFMLKIKLNDYRIYYSLGVVYYELGDYDKAYGFYQKSIEIDVDGIEPYIGMAEVLLLKGEYLKGWEYYEKRLLSNRQYYKYLDQIPKSLEQIKNKRILVAGEQGIGDNIMFGRYLFELLKIIPTFTFQVRDDLSIFFSRLLKDTGITVVSKANYINYDFIVPLLSLPYYFKTVIEDIPNGKYLNFDSIKSEPSSIKKIGICWRGKNDPPHNRKRHTTINEFLNIFDLRDYLGKYRLYNLQYELTEIECDVLNQFDITNSMGEIKDITQTIALMQKMDLVITIDTSIAHLAGAMGLKTFLLLPFSPDWRWLLGIDDNPWYQSMKLFRQDKRGDWDSVFGKVKTEFIKFIEM